MVHSKQTQSESVEFYSASTAFLSFETQLLRWKLISSFVLIGQFLPISTKSETGFNVNKHVTSTSKDGNAYHVTQNKNGLTLL